MKRFRCLSPSPQKREMIYYKPMENNAQRRKRPFREWLLSLCGYEIWPPTHNDPRIQGPQPRILTRRQWEVMQKMRSETEGTEGFSDDAMLGGS